MIERFENGDVLCRAALEMCMEYGTESSPRGMRVLELVEEPTVLILNDVRQPFMMSIARRPNYRFGLAEACWILGGREDVETIAGFNARMREFTDDGEHLWGAYGPRVASQLSHVVSVLRRDPDSRQAVLTTWRPMVRVSDQLVCNTTAEDEKGLSGAGVQLNCVQPQWDGASWRSKDVPCTVAWQFMIRGGRLNLTVYMRSNDAYLGLPYDLLSFTTVQRAVAALLNVEPGSYRHVVGNMHLYHQHWDKADEIMDEPMSRTPMPMMPEFFNVHRAEVSDVVEEFDAVFRSEIPENELIEPFMAPFYAAVHRQPKWSTMYRNLMKRTRGPKVVQK